MFKNDYLKVAVTVPKVYLGNSMKNVLEMIQIAKKASEATIVLFPELAISGYSLGDWHFNNQKLYEEKAALKTMIDASNEQIWIVGGVFEYLGSLYNCAYVLQNKKVLGIVPKSYLPRSKEFSEPRFFASGKDFLERIVEVELFDQKTSFGSCLFYNSDYDVCFGVEICGDIWSVSSPNENLYVRGAQIVFNASASSYHLGKTEKRRALVNSASLKGNGAYVYTSTGISETASDVVFMGHMLASVDDTIILDDPSVSLESTYRLIDIDLESIRYLRASSGWLHDYQVDHSFRIPFNLENTSDYVFSNEIDAHPFVPKKDEDFEEIIRIISTALYHRLNYIGIDKVVLGISGGLDSTVALLMCVECFKKFNIPLENIIAYTMPGLATGVTSQKIAIDLMSGLKVTGRIVNVGEEVNNHLALIGHDQKTKDTTYENAQARYRTYLLMNVANKEKAIVIGTGDMSEIALGWSTFNGDQMSMYNLNGGLPKTTIQALLKYFIKKYPNISVTLNEVINAPITPELVSSSQATEDVLGKYEINDFIMYHIFSQGASEQRVIFLLEKVFELSFEEAKKYYRFFMHRFNANQFKRLASPESIKIFNISLSPHGDFKYPGDIK